MSKDRICLACGEEVEKLTKDHVVPRVVLRDTMGRYRYARFCSRARKVNLQPLCSDCNSRKGDRVIDWRDQYRHDELRSLLKQWGVMDQIEFENPEEVVL